ncbi:radical SAM protein [Halococcoides cellulosivorans]|uniref:Radical SAM protein n=1 Tax=Halococcoides cellulosivorans TaxID=1679096 RepID=A0A2R4WY26_9EURY|nr:radical SAM protein [Halococcoides cellulosivorans]AWB26420.1 radical SAM protein [Halococcoides cellulosivorans]
MTDVTIVDGYVDEPAHFGVPPYISTYPRYVAGALVDAGVERRAITYHTIDALREERQRWGDVADADLVVYVGGMTVPGQYVGGTPATPEEAREVAWTADGTTLMGGPVRFGVGDTEGRTETERDDLDFDYVAGADVEAAAHDLALNDLSGVEHRYRDLEESSRWAREGAFIVEQHPTHPDYLICEIETGRGCAYRCSFCTEPLYGDATFRDAESIVDEVDALADHGVRSFRLGRQADLLAYDHGRKPNPAAIERLYRGIRAAVPDLETLHLDNVNPRTIVEFPERSREALATIAEYNTAGDTAAFGLESADPVVQDENDLQVSADECFRAIEIVNEVAGWRPETGDDTTRLPKLLPGINLLHGLKGEREETFAHNQRFLERVLDAGLMVRRINVRQVMTFEGTEMAEVGTEIAVANQDRFRAYKREIRETVDRPMLERVVPPGTVLEDVHLEYHEEGTTFGRQLGTYPLLVGIPGERDLGRTLDIAITDHGFRSVTGVPYPLDANAASMDELATLPGVTRSRAGDLVVDRPYESPDDVPGVLDPFVRVG